MKKNVFILIALFLPFFLEAGEDNWALNNSFTVTGDFAYFKRELSHKHKLILDSAKRTCNCRFPSCNSEALVRQFDFEPGFKVGASYMTRHTIWDLSYLWLDSWEGRCSKVSPGMLLFSVKNPNLTFDFSGADQAEAEYSSQFQNCELNFYRYETLRYANYFAGAWMAGLRYINLREALDISFIKGSDKSSYNVHTMNHVPAVQVGGLIAWNPTTKLSWEFLAKVGIGFDIAEQKTFLGDLNNSVVVRDYEKSGFSTPLVTEAAITLTYQPWTFLNIHGAYQVIYLNGVVLAPDQLRKSSNNEAFIEAIGAPLIHGLIAGLSWSF